MTANGWLQIALFTVLIALLVRPLGGYMTRVFHGEPTALGRLLGPVEGPAIGSPGSTRLQSTNGSNTRLH